MAFPVLLANFGDIFGGLLATLALDPAAGIAPPDARARPVSALPAVAQACGAPAPAFAMMVRSDQTVAEQRADPRSAAQTVMRAADGLFYIDAVINGARVRFLIDTGATTIILTRADAARAGVLPDAAAFTATASTAGGDTAMAHVELKRVVVANSLDFDVPAVVAGDGLGVSLLGASWLTQITSLTIAGDRMLLQ